MKKGKVFLIGAGPGDAGLFTLKGKAALENADVVVYDFLVNPKILKYAKETAKHIYAGKSGSSHTMEQDKINRLLEKEAKKGNVVARLKGGDPFVFGRGGEEAEYLSEQKITFEIIPGITSAIAGPAYAGIPVTHRGLSSSFTVLTGHKRGNNEELPDIDFKKIADKNSTLVILMGLKNLSRLTKKLMEGGMPAEMPAAIISWATYNKQITVAGKLSDIAQKAKENGLAPPTIIIIGRVVEMRKKLAWFENRPLFGKRIMVTRTRKQASALTLRLEELGAEVIEFPTIEFKELPDTKDVRQAFDSLGTSDYIVFTSQNGVDVFGSKLARLGKDSRALCKAKICAIGSETAKELEKLGLKADI
ncbi:MAG: uroporphyrinogen-III C-methyltransferase, partial [Candidatus Margulisiibacteriota bacterium]